MTPRTNGASLPPALLRTFLSLAALALVVVAKAAEAADASAPLVVDLDYWADPALPDCPEAEEFRDAIRRQSGYDPFQSGARHRLRAELLSNGSGTRGVITWSDDSGQVYGERDLRLEQRDCRELAPMVAFAIVVQLDLFNHQRTPTGPRDAPDTPSSGPPRPDADVDEAPAPGGDRGTAPRWQLALGLGPFVGAGFTSEFAFGGRAFVDARREYLRAEVGVEGSAPRVTPTGGGEGFEENLILGSLATCAGSTSVVGCVVGKAGSYRVRGVGVDVPRSSSGLVVQVGPRLSVGHGLSPSWAGSIRIDLLVALRPWGVQLDHEEVWRSPALGVLVGLDLTALVHDNSSSLPTIPTGR